MRYDSKERFWNTIESKTERKLYTTLKSALQKRYGPSVDPAIAKRVREEWMTLKVGSAFQNVAVLYQFTQRLKQQKEPYWLRGTDGVNLILYLLGITAGNPLPPHYYCPRCHNVIWCDDCTDGFDLPPGRVCEKDGALLCRDGHNIPWPVCWSFRKEDCVRTWRCYSVTVARSLPEQIKGYLRNHGFRLEGWERPVPISFREDPQGGPVYEFSDYQLMVHCLLEENQTGSVFYDIKPDADHAPDIVKNHELFFQYDASTEEEERLHNWPVNTFGDLVAKWGLIASDGAWDETARQMVEEDGYSLSHLIAFREDVFTYLLSHGFSARDAWRGMEQVRDGQSLPFVTEEMKSAPDKWMLERCKKIRCLSPKANMVEYLLFCMRAKTQSEDQHEDSPERLRI